MWHPIDEYHEVQQNKAAPTTSSNAVPTRTILSVVLTADAEKNSGVIACTVAAIEALPCVADVTTRKVRTRLAQPKPTS